jgi:hypothetical protein
MKWAPAEISRKNRVLTQLVGKKKDVPRENQLSRINRYSPKKLPPFRKLKFETGQVNDLIVDLHL